MFKRIKDGFLHIFSNRLVIIGTVFGAMALLLIVRLFTLQIVKGEEYLDNFKLQIHKSQEIKATRGKIYDRNGNVLAYNELAYAVTIEDNGAFDNMKRKDKNARLNEIVLNLLNILEANGDTPVTYFKIELDDAGNYQYMDKEGSTRNRFIADVYGEKSFDDLSLSQQNATASDIVKTLCEDRYYLDQAQYERSDILRILNIRYAMSQISYSKYLVTTVAKDVSDATVTMVKENSDKLIGVDISEESLRVYNDPEYFSSIIGYTGVMSSTEYDELSTVSDEYALNDIVGKAGIEQSMDLELRGKKGEKTFYVDSTGTVLETTDVTDPVAGGDLYLTIDKDLQIMTYKILERELAGIISVKLIDEMTYDPHTASSTYDIMIPLGDVLCAMIGNSVLDMNAFAAADPNSVQARVYEPFVQRQNYAVESVVNEINNPSSTYHDLDDEMKDYALYITKDLLTSQMSIIDRTKVEISDEVFKAWYDDGSVTMRAYLDHCISMGWIDTEKLEDYMSADGKYADAEQIIAAIDEYLRYFLPKDDDFNKLVYKYMILDNTISGTDICLMLYEQGVLEWDEEAIGALNAGAISVYDFMKDKITNLQITPAQLALEPCTASAVVTDPDSGEVLACVSYPGYDNNRLSNTMDTDYYNKLVADRSRPLYNNATQVKCAPGSTYKLVTTTAGLESGVISEDMTNKCTGTYMEVTPHPRCWIYPDGHGTLSIEEAIQESCNCFFYEVGYQLGIDEYGTYSTNQGIQILSQYAADYGFDAKSGIELDEVSPDISDTDSVRSAIGQGANSYTNTQMARYVTTLANKGTVYNLSILEKLVGADGKIIEDYEPEVYKTLDYSKSTWKHIHEGMRKMANASNKLVDLKLAGFKSAGKTGTAELSSIHADNVMYIGFAPYNSPEIAFSIRITNGYTSGYCASIGNALIKYYFGLQEPNSILDEVVYSVTAAEAGD